MIRDNNYYNGYAILIVPIAGILYHRCLSEVIYRDHILIVNRHLNALQRVLTYIAWKGLYTLQHTNNASLLGAKCFISIN
jgi:hypothetical protein